MSPASLPPAPVFRGVFEPNDARALRGEPVPVRLLHFDLRACLYGSACRVWSMLVCRRLADIILAQYKTLDHVVTLQSSDDLNDAKV